MIDTDKYEGHTPAPWNVSRGQRNTVLIESETLGCSDCGSADIYTYENTNGEEIQFPHSVEPAPFTLSPDKYYGKWQMYCPSCDLLDWAKPIDATQNDTDLELIADAPLLLAEVERLQGEPEVNCCPTCGSSDITIYDSFVDSGSHKVSCEADGCESRWFEIWRHVGIEMIEGDDNR